MIELNAAQKEHIAEMKRTRSGRQDLDLAVVIGLEGVILELQVELGKAEASLNETWLEPVEHGPDAWRRPTAEAYARACVLLRKARAELEARHALQCKECLTLERKGVELCHAYGNLLIREHDYKAEIASLRQDRSALLDTGHLPPGTDCDDAAAHAPHPFCRLSKEVHASDCVMSWCAGRP
jgi:hypothetical protein